VHAQDRRFLTLHLMRHGQSNYNLLGLCNDDPRDDVHLTDTGRRQAERAAEELHDARLTHIWVSQLPRTRETAVIINRYHQAPLTAHAALNDIRSGFNGRPVAEYFAATGHDRLHARINGGESLRDYRARVLPFLQQLHAHAGRTVLAVAHEETLGVPVAHLRGLPDADMLNLHFGNCEIVTCTLAPPPTATTPPPHR
jgi:broad specificity phosphatase PhoE